MIKNEDRLRKVVADAIPILSSYMNASAEQKDHTDQWSKKEILGHLTDSAINNHRRFIIAQQQDHMVFDGYDQVFWVAVNDYQNRDWYDIIDTWARYNHHLSQVIQLIPGRVLFRTILHHNLDKIAFRAVPFHQVVTLDYFIKDYIDHIEHHLNQLIEAYQFVNEDRTA